MRFIPTSRIAQALAPIGWCAPAAGLAIGICLTVSSSASAQAGDEAVHAVTYLDVSTDWVLQGVGLIKQYREASAHQTGNLEFTALQEAGRPNRFVIVEGWKDQASFDAHAKSPVTAQFDFVLAAIRNSPPNQHVLRAYATGPARPGAGSGAVSMVEHVDFAPPFNAAGEPAVKALAQSSRNGADVLRYDIYQEPPPHANHYSVVAVWASRKAYDAHETAPSTRQFRAATALPGRANLYDQRLYNVLD
jgi:quinol monooxygenase YgiN